MELNINPTQTKSGRGARIFVWSVWLGMILFALSCVVKYGSTIPLAEDWLLVAPMTGNEPNLLGWLWAQNNEHRIPLPRLILLGLLKITRGDLRAGMILNILTMSGVAFAAIQVARHLRGRTSYADAFFPLALLHIGNWPNFFWCWQFTFVLPTALTYAILLVLVTQPMLSTPTSALIAGICLILLPLCGANGLLLVPFLGLWFGYCGLREKRWIGKFLLGSVAIAFCLIGIYFIGYERPTWNPPNPGLKPSLQTAANFLAYSFGPIASKFWRLYILAAFAVIIPSIAITISGFFRHRGWERYRALSILLFFGILLLFALVIGYGRAGLVPTAGFPIRYVIFATPVLVTAFFAWEIYGKFKLKTIFQRGIFLGMCLLLPFNTMAGFEMFGNWYIAGVKVIEQDIKAGTSRNDLAKKHRDFLVHWWDENRLEANIQMLHDAKIEPFIQIQK